MLPISPSTRQKEIISLVQKIVGDETVLGAQPLAVYALVLGFIEQESSFRPDAFANDRRGGSYGLMQLELQTAYDMGLDSHDDSSVLYDPETNIRTGYAYLKWIQKYLLSRGHKDPDDIIAAYNEGVGAVVKGLKDPSYVKGVKRRSARWLLYLQTQELSPLLPPAA